MMHIRTTRRLRPAGAVAATLLTIAACSSSTTVQRGSGVPADLPNTPVVLVHGYNAAACPGTDVTRAQWGGVYLALTRAGWPGPVLPVSYYACDRDGVDITGYGPTPPTGATPALSPGTPRVRYDQNTSIEQLAHDLGWFVYDTFERAGRPVDLVGISMGGLIIRDLLYRTAAHDSRYPPQLSVLHAVTFSTPYRGYGGQGASSICPAATLECRQFAVGAPLLDELNAAGRLPQGAGGTAWAVAGSSAGCDLVPATSSLGVVGAQRIDYLSPCYTHTGYLYDSSPVMDASARITEPDGSTTTTNSAPRSLSWLVRALADR